LVHGWATSQDQAFKNYAHWRNGENWAAQVVTALWELAFSIWCDRNAVLHDTQENHPDIDPDAVDLSILEEWTPNPHGIKAADLFSSALPAKLYLPSLSTSAVNGCIMCNLPEPPLFHPRS
jgi:hypothetical protein